MLLAISFRLVYGKVYDAMLGRVDDGERADLLEELEDPVLTVEQYVIELSTFIQSAAHASRASKGSE
jgi:hypothetical protein